MAELRVLLVTKGLGLGGAERVMLQTAEVLAADGCSFSVLNLDARRQELVVEVQRLCLPLKQLSYPQAWTPRSLWRMVRWLRAQRIQLIHAHLPMAGVYARVLGRLAGCPVVYSEHSLVTKYWRLTHVLNKATYGWHARTIAVSQAVLDSILASYGAVHASRMQLIPNGIDPTAMQAAAAGPDPRPELGLPPDAQVVGTVASFRPMKRLDLLLRAFARLAPAATDTRLLLVGYGSIQPDLERLADELGIAGRVTFTGLRHDALRLLRAMDVFVICSDWEGLPMALLEAMALARPIVATRVGGIPEVLVDGVSGRLIPAGDEAALADAVAGLLASPGQASELGRGARMALDGLSGARDMASAVRQVYRQVVQV